MRIRPFVLLCMLGLAGCSPGRAFEAVDLLTGLSEQPAPPPPLTGIEREEITYAADRPADLYLPDTPEAALVVVPGAAREGRRDPRLVAFATDLAQADFLVMVPALAGADPLRVSSDDAEAVAAAVERLSDLTGAPQVGLVGISYAAGPALLAALEPGTREQVGFVLVIGGYHDILSAITYMTTGAYRAAPGTAWRRGPVNPRAKWFFLRDNADRVSGRDEDLLADVARRRLADPDAAVQDLVARLGPDGRAVWRLLTNDDPERVAALVAALPPRLRREIAALDLARRDLSRLQAELILVHGRDDPMVPYTESVDLARRVGPDQAHLYLVDALHHVELADVGLGDALTLTGAAYRLLSARDAAPSPDPDRPDAEREESGD